MACRSADSHLLYQGSEDLSVRVWDIRSADSQPSMHLTGYVYFPLCMSLQESGHLLATGTKGFNAVGCGVMLWDLRNTSKPLHELKGHTQDVTGCSFLPGNQDTIISACKDGSVFVWDVNALQTSKSFQFPKKWISSLQVFEDFPLSSLAMSDPQNQAQFAIGSLDGSVSMMSFDKNDAQQPLKVHFSSKAMLDGDDADSTA